MTLSNLRRQVGDFSQLVSTREVRLSDGNEDGVRAIDVRVAGGLSALVLADRGLDLGPTWVAGHQVSWQSTTGIVAPAFFDGTGTHWLRSFHGGLLVTCGLQNVGGPNEDEGVAYGLHGRISNIPARNVTHRVVEQDGRLVAEVTGEVRETDVFGSDLVLRRRLRFPMGEPVVEIADEVVNQGYVPTAMLILYHVNIGYPVVAEGSVLVPPAGDMVEPLNDEARANVATHRQFPAPRDGFLEQAFEHRIAEPVPDRVTASIVNPSFEPTGGIAASLTWNPRQLPRLWQWRMLGPGMYLTGLEPSNGTVRGRAATREEGALDVLDPGATRRFDLRIEVPTGSAAAQLDASDRP
jgi:hypothetical protein